MNYLVELKTVTLWYQNLKSLKRHTHSQNMDKKCLNFEHVRQKLNFDFER